MLIPARVLRWEQRFLQLAFHPATVQDEVKVVQAVFGRADAWTDWANYPEDRPIASLWRVLVSIRGLFRPRDRGPMPPSRLGGPGAAASQNRRPGAAETVTALVIAVGLGIGSAHAQQPMPVPPPMGGQGGFTVRSMSGNYTPRVRPDNTGITPAPVAPTPLAPASSGAAASSTPASPYVYTGQPQTGAPAAGAPTAGTPTSGPFSTAPVTVPSADSIGTPSTRRIVLTIRQLGAQGPLQLRGSSELQGVEFGVRADEVVTQAELNLSGAMSPSMIPEFSNVTVTMNDQYVGTIPVNKEHPRFDNLIMNVNPVFFQDNNRLNFRFTGRYTIECNDPLSGLLWATIADTSTLTMTLERLPPQRDLARLPLPFFDNHEKQTLVLPFVLPANATNEALEASGIISSWFGMQADYRGARFPVTQDSPPDGNAVLIVTGDEHPPGVQLPTINGPTVAVIPNPHDAQSSLLLIAGRNGEEAVQAARALTLDGRALGGPVASVEEPNMPARKPYDAPYWIPTNGPVKFGQLVDAADLQGTGYVPGTMRVPFRTAPDLFTWRNRSFPMELRFRSPPGPIVDLAASRLDVLINNIYLKSFPLASDQSHGGSWMFRAVSSGEEPAARVDVPFYDVFGQNDLQFFFDARPLHRGDCVAVPQDLRMSIDPDSTVDLSRAYRVAELPNLAYFVNSGFPFTRMADLSNTAVVLPQQPTAGEITAYLDTMGRLSAITGYPVVHVTVVRPDEARTVADKDLLVISTMDHLGDGSDLLRNSPYQLVDGKLQVKVGGQLESVYRMFGDQGAEQRVKADATLGTATPQDSAVMVGSESPLSHDRSLLAMLAGKPVGLENIVFTMRDGSKAPLIQGDMAVMSGDQVTSYRVGPTYTVGFAAMPFWVWPSWYLRNQPWGTMALMVVGCVLVGFAFFWALRRHASRRVASRTIR